MISEKEPAICRNNRDYVYGIWECGVLCSKGPLMAMFMGPTWDPSGADRTQVGPMLAPWTLLSGTICEWNINIVHLHNEKRWVCFQMVVHNSGNGGWRLHNEPAGNEILFFGLKIFISSTYSFFFNVAYWYRSIAVCVCMYILFAYIK